MPVDVMPLSVDATQLHVDVNQLHVDVNVMSLRVDVSCWQISKCLLILQIHNRYDTTGCRLATRSHSQLAYVIYFYALAA
ncbi:MAG: hypothetical protein ACYTXC_18250 [Nostoc sp.]